MIFGTDGSLIATHSYRCNFIMYHGLRYARLPYITAPILPMLNSSRYDLSTNISAVFLEMILLFPC